MKYIYRVRSYFVLKNNSYLKRVNVRHTLHIHVILHKQLFAERVKWKKAYTVQKIKSNKKSFSVDDLIHGRKVRKVE